MRKVEDGLWIVDVVTDLVYSPDDNGFYFVEHSSQDDNYDTRTSQTFPTKNDAELALQNSMWDKDSIKWNEWS